MANSSKVLRGVDEAVKALLELAPQLRRRAAAAALRAGARVVQRYTLPFIPVLKAPIYRRGVMIRKPGTVAMALKVRTSRDTARSGDVGVFVGIKPAKGSDRGKYSPNDPYYWRWLQFRPLNRRFLEKGAEVLPGAALDAVAESLGPQIQRLNQPGAKL